MVIWSEGSVFLGGVNSTHIRSRRSTAPHLHNTQSGLSPRAQGGAISLNLPRRSRVTSLPDLDTNAFALENTTPASGLAFKPI